MIEFWRITSHENFKSFMIEAFFVLAKRDCYFIERKRKSEIYSQGIFDFKIREKEAECRIFGREIIK